MKRKLNPVSTMNSVDALDLMVRAYDILRKDETCDRALLASLKEQVRRHTRALSAIIGDEEL